MKKIIIAASLFIALIGLVSFVQNVNAASLAAGPLSISYSGGTVLFSESDVAPGPAYSRDITVTNNGTVSHSFALATTNVSGGLADKMYLEPAVSGSPVWKMSIADLSNLPTQSKTVIGSITPGSSVVVTLNASMDENSDNSYQNKDVSFDLVFGTEEAEPTPTPSATAGGFTVAAAGSPTVSLSPVVSPSPNPSPAGEVKGAEAASSESAGGKPWQLLIVVPAAVMASFLFPLASRTGIRTAIASGVIAVAFGLRYSGNVPSRTFWILLIAEIILIGVANYLLVARLKRLMVQAETEVAVSKQGREKKEKQN